MILTIVGNILHKNGFAPGRIIIDGETIRAVELGRFGANGVDFFLPDSYVGPGLIDLQLNGGLGKDFTAYPEAAAEVAAYLPSTGVTGFLPTIITAPLETHLRGLAETARVMQAQPDGARILGIHLEGPYISPAHKGAHDPCYIRLPSLGEAEHLIAAAAGALRIVTMAPELPGAHDVARLLRQHGVIVSAGHAAASYDEAMAGFDAGFGWVTHLFNAQPPLHHRMPGLPAAALTRRGLNLGLIADGVHVHPAVCDIIYRAKGTSGITLVSDAMAALGLGPGNYEIGGQAVEVTATTAHLAGKDTLAGSVLTMDRAVANMVAFANVPLHEAWRMASTVPAALLGLAQYGDLRPGAAADLLIASKEMAVAVTICRGKVVYADYVMT